MGEDDDGRRSGFAFEIVFQPLELIRAERAKAVLLEIDDIVERHEMHAALIERIPAAAGRSLAEALEIGGRAWLGIEDVVLAGRVMDVELRRGRSFASASSNSFGLAVWLMSPVWIMNAGLPGIAMNLVDRRRRA